MAARYLFQHCLQRRLGVRFPLRAADDRRDGVLSHEPPQRGYGTAGKRPDRIDRALAGVCLHLFRRGDQYVDLIRRDHHGEFLHHGHIQLGKL